MKRRALLAAVGSGWLAVSGCVADDSGSDDTGTGDGATPTDATNRSRGSDADAGESAPSDESDIGETDDEPGGSGTDDADSDAPGDDRRRYEECSREVVRFHNLPDELQAEVTAALDGPYAADRVFLREATDVEESYLSIDERFYRPDVADTGSADVLTLERVEPKAFPDPRPVSLQQFRDGDRTITLTAVAENGDGLLEETRTLAPEIEVEVAAIRRAGTHDLHVTVEKAGHVVEDATRSFRIDVSRRSIHVTVDEEISVGGGVAYVVPCEYDAD